jgi:hypothetical protein
MVGIPTKLYVPFYLYEKESQNIFIVYETGQPGGKVIRFDFQIVINKMADHFKTGHKYGRVHTKHFLAEV